MERCQSNFADIETIAILQVDINIGSRRSPVHHHPRTSEVSKVPGPGAVVRVGVGIDDVFEPKAMVGEHRDIPVDPLFDWIDEQCLPRPFAADQVGLAIGSIELVKDHRALPPSA